MSVGAFLDRDDELGKLIEAKSAELYERLLSLNADSLGMPANCLEYFKGSHHKRLFFSIQTSAHLLYRSIARSGKRAEELVIMDYGAGVGTLYTLAKMIGCKKVIYNDHLPEWQISAHLIANAIGVEVDEYIVGDIHETLEILNEKNISCTIITSRNVIEHIYKLDEFFRAVALYQPNAMLYNSTTANYMNPATRLQHLAMHKKWEKEYVGMRRKIIQTYAPSLTGTEINTLALLTQGKAGSDIEQAVNQYLTTRTYPAKNNTRSNTCHPYTGVWVEHLLTFDEYRNMASPHYTLDFAPGFWDTHYSKTWKNWLAHLLNGVSSMATAPFIYVIAEKK